MPRIRVRGISACKRFVSLFDLETGDDSVVIAATFDALVTRHIDELLVGRKRHAIPGVGRAAEVGDQDAVLTEGGVGCTVLGRVYSHSVDVDRALLAATDDEDAAV